MTVRPRIILVPVGLALAAACSPAAMESGPSVHASPTAVTAPAPLTPVADLPRVDVPPLKTDWTPQTLAKACAQAEKVTDARLAKVVAIPDARRTFANTVAAYESATFDYKQTVSRLTFMKEIHPNAKVRAAGSACEERSGKYSVQLGARKDLYLAVQGYLKNQGAHAKLHPQQKRLIQIVTRNFRKHGLALPDAQRAKLVKLRQKIAALQTEYSTNLNNADTHFQVPIAELTGMPKSFINRHQKSKDGKSITLTTEYPDYYPLMENCSNEAVRRKMELAFQDRGGPENLKLLDEATHLRAEAAHLLGFATHTDFVAQDRMAKNAKTIEAFLARLRRGLAPALVKETAQMQALKRKDTHNPKAVIDAWDWRYYMNRLKDEHYHIDEATVRSYFPAPKVMQGLFATYSTLFSISIKKVPDAKVWAKGVAEYEIHDAKSGGLLAKFYVDMYPRPGKYSHAAEFSMNFGHVVKAGYSIPMAVLVVNFNPPSNGHVAHLSMEEVETLFHEFGHVMHESLTTARYAALAGTNVARDFVEAPSQMLENWPYQPQVLALISQDPKNPSKTMPKSLAQRIAQARYFDAGVTYSRQVFLGLFDVDIHTHDHTNCDVEAKKLWAQVMGYPQDKGAHFAGTFGHMMGGYDGAYYGYLWSKVFASDMFTRFQKAGVLNPKMGMTYRKDILARGRTVEPEKLLEDFLGRKPNQKAFLEQLGITPAAEASAASITHVAADADR